MVQALPLVFEEMELVGAFDGAVQRTRLARRRGIRLDLNSASEPLAVGKKEEAPPLAEEDTKDGALESVLTRRKFSPVRTDCSAPSSVSSSARGGASSFLPTARGSLAEFKSSRIPLRRTSRVLWTAPSNAPTSSISSNTSGRAYTIAVRSARTVETSLVPPAISRPASPSWRSRQPSTPHWLPPAEPAGIKPTSSGLSSCC